MKMFLGIVISMTTLLNSSAAVAQNGNMMNASMWNAGWMGGYGGMWVPILLCIIVVAAVVWMLVRKGK